MEARDRKDTIERKTPVVKTPLRNQIFYLYRLYQFWYAKNCIFGSGMNADNVVESFVAKFSFITLICPQFSSKPVCFWVAKFLTVRKDYN